MAFRISGARMRFVKTDGAERLVPSETVKRIASHVPGYVGYSKKESREASDLLIRNYVASAASSALAKLADPEARERVGVALEGLKRKLETRDYSRFFELGEIDEEILEQVYARDLALVEAAKMLEDAEGADQTAELLKALERALDSRNKVLKDISEAPPAVLKPRKKRESLLRRILRG